MIDDVFCRKCNTKMRFLALKIYSKGSSVYKTMEYEFRCSKCRNVEKIKQTKKKARK